MGAKIPHKKIKTSSTYIYKIDPKGYFGENPNSTNNIPNGVDKSTKKEKVAKKVSPSNDPIEEEEYRESILPPQDHKLEASSILIEESRPININLTETPRITYIETSLPQE